MKKIPHPYTFSTHHLRQLEERARGAKTHEDAQVLAEDLVSGPPEDRHVERATYNRALRRIEVALHGGHLAFPLPVGVAA